jgi:hypothetical protein
MRRIIPAGKHLGSQAAFLGCHGCQGGIPFGYSDAMTPFQGRVMQGGRAIFDDINGALEEMLVRRELKDWHGYFVVPYGQFPPPIGGSFNLFLDDGRSGPVEIRRVSPGDQSASVLHFEGTGPLS